MVGGTPAPSPVRGRRGGGGAGPAGRAGPRPGKFLGVFGVLAPPRRPPLGGRGDAPGVPRDAAAAPPPPLARHPVPVVSPRSGWFRPATFLGGLFGVGGGHQSAYSALPRCCAPVSGCPPKPGVRVGGEGSALPRLPALPCATAGGCPRPARGPLVTPSPTRAGGCEWAGGTDPSQGKGLPSTANAQWDSDSGPIPCPQTWQGVPAWVGARSVLGAGVGLGVAFLVLLPGAGSERMLFFRERNVW